MRLYLDASVWIAGLLSSNGGSHALIAQLKESDGVVLISVETVAEVIRNLQEKASAADREAFLEEYGQLHPEVVRGTKVAIARARKVINRKDALILAAAQSGQADLFVTLDKKHSLVPSVKRAVQPLMILSPGDTLALLRQL